MRYIETAIPRERRSVPGIERVENILLYDAFSIRFNYKYTGVRILSCTYESSVG